MSTKTKIKEIINHHLIKQVGCVDPRGRSLMDYAETTKHVTYFNKNDRLLVAKLPKDNDMGLVGWLVIRYHSQCGVHLGQSYVAPGYMAAKRLYDELRGTK